MLMLMGLGCVASKADATSSDINYREVNGIQLPMSVYKPKEWKPGDKRTTVIFFFGGGWVGGSREQFKDQCEFLSEKGVVGLTPEYRVSSRHKTNGMDAVADAKAAVLWTKEHADELGIDPEKIVVAGGSAGGHLAACTVMLREAEIDPQEIYKIPRAMILFNPALDVTKKVSIFGEEDVARRYSPIHQVIAGLPPTAVFHGTADQVVPYATAQSFGEKMKASGNRCELFSYENKKHGFFNYAQEKPRTMDQMEKFLKSINLIQ